MLRDSPRTRRLRSDLRALEQLRAESSILSFESHSSQESAPDAYLIKFRGYGAWRPNGSPDVLLRDQHEVTVRLGANYPRMMPEVSWRSPIFHPNISSSGFVCLGGYGTFWAPSLHLDELCIMLWDMVRYQNYDVNSPYNREAALWAKTQRTHKFPLDPRSLRDLRVRAAAADNSGSSNATAGLPHNAQYGSGATAGLPSSAPLRSTAPPPPQPDILFLSDVIEAEVVEEPDRDVLFIE